MQSRPWGTPPPCGARRTALLLSGALLTALWACHPDRLVGPDQPVVAQSPTIHLSPMDGNASPLQWSAQASGTTQPLLGVWGSSSSDVFAVGYEGVILHWNGMAWSAMTSSTGASFYGVWGSSSSDVFAVGGAGTIEHWDGAAWSAMTSGTTESFWGVWGSATDDVFAVGSNGTILHWNGTAWSAMTSGTTAQLYRVWGSSSSDVFVTGADGLILHWDGTDWSTMSSGTVATLLGVWGTASNDVVAVGAGGTILHWDGTSWSPMTSGVTDWLYGVWGNADAMYAVSDGGKVLEYDGASWTTLATGTEGTFFESIWGASERKLFAVGVGGAIIHGGSKPVATVTVSPSSATLYEVGQTQEFTAEAKDADGLTIPDTPITWASSKTSVATVSSAGVATLKGYGTATVTATSGAASGSATVTATYPDVPLSWSMVSTGQHLRDVWGTSGSDVYAVGMYGSILHYNGTSCQRRTKMSHSWRVKMSHPAGVSVVSQRAR